MLTTDFCLDLVSMHVFVCNCVPKTKIVEQSTIFRFIKFYQIKSPV